MRERGEGGREYVRERRGRERVYERGERERGAVSILFLLPNFRSFDWFLFDLNNASPSHPKSSAGRHDNHQNDTRRNDVRHNDTQHDDFRHNDTQHSDIHLIDTQQSNKISNPQYKMSLCLTLPPSVVKLNVIQPSVVAPSARFVWRKCKN